MESFLAQAKKINESYPKLSLISKSGTKILSGEIDLIDASKNVMDTYKLEIHPSDKYPFMFPLVFETGGRIPINVDWHIYPSLGNCCIKVPPEEELICKNGITLLDFIKNEVIPFFFNQTFRKENGYFINERSHGVTGLVEFYAEKLGNNDIKQIIILLGYILFKSEPNRVALCFCGKNEKYRRCHRAAYKLLSQIKRENLLMHLQMMIDYHKNLTAA